MQRVAAGGILPFTLSFRDPLLAEGSLFGLTRRRIIRPKRDPSLRSG